VGAKYDVILSNTSDEVRSGAKSWTDYAMDILTQDRENPNFPDADNRSYAMVYKKRILPLCAKVSAPGLKSPKQIFPVAKSRVLLRNHLVQLYTFFRNIP
jgi:hypothetical protein